MPPPENPWTFGAGYTSWFNVRANFSGLGGMGPLQPVPPPGATDRVYDDGFVRADISGSPTTTTHWSYQNAGQYDTTGGGSLSFSTTDVPGTASARSSDDVLPGFELFASRAFGTFPIGSHEARWGVLARMNYTHIDIGSSSSLSLDARTTRDTFPLNGVIPPLAPYTGTFNGPGPLLGTTPIRDTFLVPGGAVVSGIRELDGHLIALSAGPWVSVSPAKNFHVQLEAGLTLAVVDGDYQQHSITTTGTAAALSSSRGSDRDLLPGFYTGATAIYDINHQWSAFASLRYQYLDDFEIGAGASKASLSFSQSFIGVIGVRFRF